MDYPCEIICDLIPLHIEGESSPETEEAIGEHIKHCPDCADYYCLMFDLITQRENNLSIWEKIAFWSWADGMRWIKNNIRVLRKWFAVLVLLCVSCALLYTGWYGLTQIDCVPVSKEDYKVVKAVSLEDGSIYCAYGVRYASTFTHHYVIVDEQVYFIAMRPVLDVVYADPEAYKGAWKMDPGSVWDKAQKAYVPVTAIWLGNPEYPEDACLVWSEDHPLPAATAEDLESLEKLDWTIF